MDLYYLDSSAWVKRYIAEEGSPGVSVLFGTGISVACSMLGYIEVTAALFRRSSTKVAERLVEALDRDWIEMTQVAVPQAVLENAATLARAHRLRGADAIHLATALSLQKSSTGRKREIAMVTYDRELASASSSQMECISPVD